MNSLTFFTGTKVNVNLSAHRKAFSVLPQKTLVIDGIGLFNPMVYAKMINPFGTDFQKVGAISTFRPLNSKNVISALYSGFSFNHLIVVDIIGLIINLQDKYLSSTVLLKKILSLLNDRLRSNLHTQVFMLNRYGGSTKILYFLKQLSGLKVSIKSI
jgi:hypothetical protein